jgi:hypothetical protein
MPKIKLGDLTLYQLKTLINIKCAGETSHQDCNLVGLNIPCSKILLLQLEKEIEVPESVPFQDSDFECLGFEEGGY